MTTDYVIGERAATEKQLDYILRLAECEYFSQIASRGVVDFGSGVVHAL